jgi:hypothetical protein
LSNTRPQNYARIAGAIVVAAVVISGSILAASYFGTATTITQTKTVIGTGTVTASLSNSTSPTRTILHYPANTTLRVSAIPKDFLVGDYSFHIVCQGNCFLVNGTFQRIQCTCANLYFNVTQSNQASLADFFWGGTTIYEVPPTQPTTSVFGGHVTMSWFTNSSALYLRITTFPSKTAYSSASTTFRMSTTGGGIPGNFTLGQYSFHTVTGVRLSVNGSDYPSFNVLLTVTHQKQNQEMLFQWAPIPPYDHIPTPTNVSVFDGNVRVAWFTNSSGLYVRIAAFPGIIVFASVTFKYPSLPKNFQVGEYSFTTLCGGQSCGYSTDGRVFTYTFPTILFNVTARGQSVLMDFGWTPGGPYNVIPGPLTASAFNGQVTFRWFQNNTGIYVNILANG